jgi:hypothetical protein
MLPEAGFWVRLAANELHVPIRIDKFKEKLFGDRSHKLVGLWNSPGCTAQYITNTYNTLAIPRPPRASGTSATRCEHERCSRPAKGNALVSARVCWHGREGSVRGDG